MRSCQVSGGTLALGAVGPGVAMAEGRAPGMRR